MRELDETWNWPSFKEMKEFCVCAAFLLWLPLHLEKGDSWGQRPSLWHHSVLPMLQPADKIPGMDVVTVEMGQAFPVMKEFAQASATGSGVRSAASL